MTKPKKRLPTGPINIPSKTLVAAGNDSTYLEENKNLENKKLDSDIPESSLVDSIKHETIASSSNEVVLVTQEKTIPDSSKQDSSKQEKIKIDSSSLEVNYKKVAMRLSEESVAKLRTLKMSTGIPYEVIVDSFIRNWEVLPAALVNQILTEAKEERIKRLVAGQEKATKTVRKKLEDI